MYYFRRKTYSKETYRYFDKLHKSGFMTKEDAYYWLAATVDATMKHAHIGHLSEYYCKKVIKDKVEIYNILNKAKSSAPPSTAMGIDALI